MANCGCNMRYAMRTPESQMDVCAVSEGLCSAELEKKRSLMQQITECEFICIDINLYLDTHPCDPEAIEYFKEHVQFYNEALAEYSKSYGPLTLAHAHHCDTYWDWVNQPWPWQ